MSAAPRLIPRYGEGIRVKSVRGGGWLARLSDKRSEVICLAKPEISLIKVVRTAVWETMVAPSETPGRSAKVRSARLRGKGRPLRENGAKGEAQKEEERTAEAKRGELSVLTPAKAVQ